MKFVYVALPVLSALAAAVPAAEETQPAVAAPVELFKGPKGIDLKPPSYPQSERLSGGEGWVIVNVMIDPEGKPYEPTVVDSTGNKVFEKVALETVEKWRFEPASMNGTPIHAGSTLKLQFQLSGETGAREQFVKAYGQLVKAVDAGDRERADSRLALLEVAQPVRGCLSRHRAIQVLPEVGHTGTTARRGATCARRREGRQILVERCFQVRAADSTVARNSPP